MYKIALMIKNYVYLDNFVHFIINSLLFTQIALAIDSKLLYLLFLIIRCFPYAIFQPVCIRFIAPVSSVYGPCTEPCLHTCSVSRIHIFTPALDESYLRALA